MVTPTLLALSLTLTACVSTPIGTPLPRTPLTPTAPYIAPHPILSHPYEALTILTPFSRGSAARVSHNGITVTLTAAHVIASPFDPTIPTTLPITVNGTPATVLYFDHVSDIAILTPPDGTPTTTTLAPTRPVVGDPVISATRFYLAGIDAHDPLTFTGTYAGWSSVWRNDIYHLTTLPGASGSAIYNTDNEIVGVVLAVYVSVSGQLATTFTASAPIDAILYALNTALPPSPL